MKLAEALMLRADMCKKIASLRERIARNALVQEGDEPDEEPASLIEQIHTAIEEFAQLAGKIHRANHRSPMTGGQMISDALTRRVALTAQHAALQHAIKHTQKDCDRYGVREIRWVSRLNVAELNARADHISRQIRELNAAIQKANWDAELA